MSDLTIPIIGLTTLVGYYFSREGRNPRVVERRQTVETFDKPSGNNIYKSNQYDAVNKEMLERSLQKYKDAQNPAITGVLPPLYNTYSAVGNDSVLSGDIDVGINKADVNNLVKLVDVTKTKRDLEIDQRPMFKQNMTFIGNERTDVEGVDVTSITDSQVSLLTGKPIDTSHNNMVPFFGSNVKQNVEKFVSEPLLDNQTGNVSTFFHKKEISPFGDKVQQNIYGTPVFTTKVDTDRFVPSLYRQNEKPFTEERVSAQIAGTIDNPIMLKFFTVDQLRTADKPKESYAGRTLDGQKGNTRGIQGQVIKKSPETFYEKTFDHYFKTTGGLTAPIAEEDFSTNFRDTSRQSYNTSYYGTASAVKDQQATTQRARLMGETTGESPDSLIQISRRQNFENDYTRNPTGNKSVNDYGLSSITTFETERATTGLESQTLNVNDTNKGLKTALNDTAKTTIKETTLIGDNSGHVKTTFDKSTIEAFEQGIATIDAKTTHKETTIINNYKGIMNKEDGMGYLVNKYEAKTTGKEIISENSEHTGNAGGNGVAKSTMVYSTYDNPIKTRFAVHAEDYRGNANYNSEAKSREDVNNAQIRDTKEIAVSGERPSGPQKFQIASGKVSYADIKSTNNLLLKEQEDSRKNIHKRLPQNIQTKDSIGYQTKWRTDNGKVDTVTGDRLQPDLIISQHNQNPYSLKKRNFLKN